MGSIYLTWLADDLEAAGLQVVRYQGWSTRARSTGGYANQPLCVMWHHTASQCSPADDSYYMCISSGNSSKPTANLLIARDGVVWVLAAGATNTNGKGRSIGFSRGIVPQDKMNEYAVGVEIANNGVGEPYLQQQIDAAFKVSNVVNARVGNQPFDVCTHNFYAPDRKIDPARASSVQGPWQPRSCTSSGTWELEDLAAECVRRATAEPPPPPGDDVMNSPAVVVTADGTVQTFVRGSDGALWMTWWDAGWVPWQYLGGQIVDSPGAEAVPGTNDIHVFGKGTDGNMYTIWWDDMHKVWSPWTTVMPWP